MAIDFDALQIRRMQLADLDEVMAIELEAYTHPWTLGNFTDSLNNLYDAWVVRSPAGEMLGYFVQMAVVDESHLLTITVKVAYQKLGLGLFLLQFLVERARKLQMKSILLEVRASNLRAMKMYLQFGFTPIGQRKNYYQMDDRQREHALVLRYEIPLITT
jgi:ribosomal-protein-alanine N-acetyltransferase